MRPRRTLVLRSEALGELTTVELRGVAGANSGLSCVPKCPTIQVECPSDPVLGCTIVQETRDCAETITCPTDIC